eukprot:g9577.t1
MKTFFTCFPNKPVGTDCWTMASEPSYTELLARAESAEARLSTLSVQYEKLAQIVYELKGKGETTAKPALARQSSKMDIKPLDVVNQRTTTAPSAPVWSGASKHGDLFPCPPQEMTHQADGVLVWAYDTRGLLEPSFHWIAAETKGQASMAASDVWRAAHEKTDMRENYRLSQLGESEDPGPMYHDGSLYCADYQKLHLQDTLTFDNSKLCVGNQVVPGSIIVLEFVQGKLLMPESPGFQVRDANVSHDRIRGLSTIRNGNYKEIQRFILSQYYSEYTSG